MRHHQFLRRPRHRHIQQSRFLLQILFLFRRRTDAGDAHQRKFQSFTAVHRDQLHAVVHRRVRVLFILLPLNRLHGRGLVFFGVVRRQQLVRECTGDRQDFGGVAVVQFEYRGAALGLHADAGK
jgi:hypothetical protein